MLCAKMPSSCELIFNIFESSFDSSVEALYGISEAPVSTFFG